MRHRPSRPDHGATAVELALAVPILLLGLLLMLVSYRAGAVHIDVTSAAGAAARAASAQRTTVAAAAAAEQTARAHLGSVCDSATVTVDTADFRPGGSVTVSLTCTVSIRTLAAVTLPGSVTSHSSATSPIDTLRSRT
ncbi:TadE/TadG family type IV pilus assembly protein [Catellatospora paridis]|uniref:TadE/TadG family type IV pilus assembly protein n=1 Tax=Catellatospora paridis TaxID=1617086 RepID=UPI0012D49A58|nr:TadE/TadG family type IV pilus assembly protein [Catellatospora paridis]